MKDDASNSLPLAPAALHILLSLAAEDLHGYGIMQDVARQSEGKYKLRPGTLYDNLQKLIRRAVGRRAWAETRRRRSASPLLPAEFARPWSSGGRNCPPRQRGA